MTPFGISLIVVMLTAFLPWTYVFGGRAALPRVLSVVALLLDTVLYYFLFFHFPSITRGAAMNIFFMGSIHLLAIALSGLVWGIVGQGLMRRFLATPTPLLLVLLAGRLFALYLALNFTPVTS